MDMFLSKLGPEARLDMFDKTPYYPLNQMTKMGIRTDTTCKPSCFATMSMSGNMRIG